MRLRELLIQRGLSTAFAVIPSVSNVDKSSTNRPIVICTDNGKSKTQTNLKTSTGLQPTRKCVQIASAKGLLRKIRVAIILHAKCAATTFAGYVSDNGRNTILRQADIINATNLRIKRTCLMMRANRLKKPSLSLIDTCSFSNATTTTPKPKNWPET